MKMRNCLAVIAVLTACGLTSSNQATAVPLVAVDFGRIVSGSPTAVQPGFTGIAGAPVEATHTEPVGVYTVTVAGEGFFSAGFNAGNADPSVNALYEDYYYHNATANGVGITLSIAGITPNVDYDVKLWSYDMDNIFSPTPTLWAPTGSTTGTSGSVTNFATPFPATLDDYSTTIRVRSTTGTLEVFGTTTGGSGGTRLNGFQLNVVPEPSTAALAGVCAIATGAVWGRGKRRKA